MKKPESTEVTVQEMTWICPACRNVQTTTVILGTDQPPEKMKCHCGNSFDLMKVHWVVGAHQPDRRMVC